MNRINIRRLQQISLDMQDCLNDMEENITIYDNSEEKYKKFLQQSFRASLVQYKELLGNYIAHCLKEVNTSVSDMTYYSAINLCIENKYLPSEKDEFYKTLSRYRNQASHTYKKPPFEIIRDFYINNKSIFEDILLYINSFINKIR
ncbi:MAG: hypothetical protein ACRC3Y_05820 [Romboutsia sp.]|uniref:hypothetical protein n=1 Tax=Romboutsia sp. TaxID=1965302 RepID=UPI003F34B9BC